MQSAAVSEILFGRDIRFRIHDLAADADVDIIAKTEKMQKRVSRPGL